MATRSRASDGRGSTWSARRPSRRSPRGRRRPGVEPGGLQPDVAGVGRRRRCRGRRGSPRIGPPGGVEVGEKSSYSVSDSTGSSAAASSSRAATARSMATVELVGRHVAVRRPTGGMLRGRGRRFAAFIVPPKAGRECLPADLAGDFRWAEASSASLVSRQAGPWGLPRRSNSSTDRGTPQGCVGRVPLRRLDSQLMSRSWHDGSGRSSDKAFTQVRRGAPGRIRTCAPASGGRCSIP